MKSIKKILIYCSLVLVGGYFSPVLAELMSNNYIITSTEISAGEAKTASTSFKLAITIGPSTPLMEATATPPMSTSHVLYPGFRYTYDSATSCKGDSEPDGDVDGTDLAAFAEALSISSSTSFNITDFAWVFGRSDCL